MEPTYSPGALVGVEPVDPATVEEGDVVVVDVPRSIERRYGYPDSIIHRVTEVSRSDGAFGFRTEGDNTGEDPFLVRAANVRGRATWHVPTLGYVVLYLKSLEGRVFLASIVAVQFFYASGPALRREAGEVVDAFVERHAPSRDVEEKVDRLDREVESVDQSLEHFASAMDEYATHLESHTAAVQNMARAAGEIHESVERQNDVLDRLGDRFDPAAERERTADGADAGPGVESHGNGAHTRFEWVGDDRARIGDDNA